MMWIFYLASAVMLMAVETVTEDSDDALIANVFQTGATTEFNPEKGGCKCIPFYQCSNGTQLRDGAGLIQFRGIKPKCVCICEGLSELCCYVPPERGSQDEGSSTVKPALTSTTTRPKKKPKCGMRRVDLFETRILGAKNKTKPSEFPWMVAIFLNDQQNGETVKRYMCAGSLIHERVVMTVAHCAEQLDVDKILLRAGAWDLRGTDDVYPHQDRFVSQVITHTGYNRRYVTNDVSLLVTTTPFKFALNVDILCLPKANDVVLSDSCIASGWGINETGAFQHELKYVVLPTVRSGACEEKLQETRLGPHFTLHDSVMCAGGVNGVDTCKGDGGSPLICPVPKQKDRYQQVGIVAGGIGCGTDIPGLYANVAFLRPWIDKQLAELGFSNNYDY